MRSILVIDPNPVILKFCQMVLAKAGYPFALSETPLQALQTLERQADIGAILIDTGFSSPSTEELLQGFEKRGKTCDIPVVLLTDNKESWRAFREDFPAVMSILKKPITPAILLETLQMATKGSALTQIRARRKKIHKSAFLAKGQTTSQPTNSAIPEIVSPPALQGQVEFMPLGEIFQMLRFQNQTGIFHIINEEKEVFLFLQNGFVQMATSKNLQSEFQFGRFLLQTRALKPSLLNKIIHQKNVDNTPLGQYLVDQEFIEPKYLERALKDQTRFLFYELLRWNKGFFTFISLNDIPEIAQKAQLNLSVEELVLEGFRRIDEWKVLEQEVGSHETILEHTPQSTALLDQLTAQEKNILKNINGSLTMEQLSERVLLPTFEVFKTCQHLVAQKILKRRSRAKIAPIPQHYDA